jgi:TM2 domain-containing membrane protein YozV
MYRLIGSDGRQYGPASAEDVRRWIAENRANAQSLVHKEGAPEWKPLGAFPEFATILNLPGATAVPPPISPPFASTDPRASTKIAAGVCAVLLGWLGIHKFILGYTGAGLVMLLVSVLTCFLAWPIMQVIGIIEGIIYLTKTDADFVRQYLENRREWF